jgi:hypothetical protein
MASAAMENYTAALKSTRTAKNVFMVLILVAILLQIVAFVTVNFLGVLDSLAEGMPGVAATQATATRPAGATEADQGAVEAASYWETTLKWLLPATKFFAPILAGMVVMTLMLAALISLMGALGNPKGFVSAFYWSLLLLAMLIPWQQVFNSTFATGALCSNLTELTRRIAAIRPEWGGQNPGTLDVVAQYGKSLAYPVLTVLVWVVVLLRFRSGYKDLAGERSIDLT